MRGHHVVLVTVGGAVATLWGWHAPVAHHTVWRWGLRGPHILIHAVANPLSWARSMSHTGSHGVIHSAAVLGGAVEERATQRGHITVGRLV